MSYIATIQGEAVYTDEEQFELAKKHVELWISDDDCAVSTERRDGEEGTEYVITVPFDTYRGLGRQTDNLMAHADGGAFVGYSNDVRWHGFVDTTLSSTEVQLNKWAEDRGMNTDDKMAVEKEFMNDMVERVDDEEFYV